MGIRGDGMLLHTVYRIVLVLAVAPLAYYLLSLYCVVAYFHELRKSPPLSSAYLPPVSILKPVRGVDREAYENFASYCRLDYPEYEIIFAVADPDDPAVPVIERLQANFAACSIRLIKGAERIGTNSKVNSLCRLVQEAKYDLMVMSDSDVRVGADYLKVVAPPFADPQVGVVTGFYRCITAGGVAADLGAPWMLFGSAPRARLGARPGGEKEIPLWGGTGAAQKTLLGE